MKTLKFGDLDFDIHDGPIGLAVSGGADSSVMCHILLTHAPGPIHFFSLANRSKQRTNPVIAMRVLSHLLDRTGGRTDVYHHSYFVEQQTRESLFQPLKDLGQQLNLSLIYTAGTALPPDIDLWDKTKFSSDCGLYQRRNQNTIRPVYNGMFYSPWWNQDKKFVAKVYHELGLTHSLYPLTRSCEDPTLREGHCGRCWWCEERIWAFGYLEHSSSAEITR